MKAIPLGAMLLVLGGCTTTKAVYLPDGRAGHTINCSGTANTWEGCYQKAGEMCKANGYEILAKDGEQGSTISGTQYGVFGSSIMQRVLVIACK